jgi:hypothetical protein
LLLNFHFLAKIAEIVAGTAREYALAAQPDEESRKALQAAWKRFDRNGMERLRAAAAKINPEKNLREF